MAIASSVLVLLMVMDPFGNIPTFLSLLRDVPPQRRTRVILRELLIAYAVMLVFLVVGNRFMAMVGISAESITISGGIVLFLIALNMLFPGGPDRIREPGDQEPFIVPLAIPLVAGPSALATLLLMSRTSHGAVAGPALALTAAWLACSAVLLSSSFFLRVLRDRGLRAMARFVGMLLVLYSVQMILNGLREFAREVVRASP